MPSICRVAAPVSFSAGIAIFQIVPSGVRTTPPWPHSDLVSGCSDVAPAVALNAGTLTLAGLLLGGRLADAARRGAGPHRRGA